MKKSPRRSYLLPLIGTCLALAIIVNVAYFAFMGGTPTLTTARPSAGVEGGVSNSLTNSINNRFTSSLTTSRAFSSIISTSRRDISRKVSELDASLLAVSWPSRQPVARMWCRDTEVLCGSKRKMGQCLGNVTVTLDTCKATCSSCAALASEIQDSTGVNVTWAATRPDCVDADPGCEEHAGLCAASSMDLAIAHCKATCKLCEVPPPPRPHQSSISPVLWAGGVSVPPPECYDDVDLCPYWAGQQHLCGMYSWMNVMCKMSCSVCVMPAEEQQLNLADLTTVRKVGECADYHPQCADWAAALLCNSNYGFMNMHCAKSCHTCQTEIQAGAAMTHATQGEHVMLGQDAVGRDVLGRFVVAQMGSTFPQDPTRKACADLNGNCVTWAAGGECVRNGVYMHDQCPFSCKDCTNVGGRVLSATAFEWLVHPLAKVRLNNGLLMPSVGFGSAGLGTNTGNAVRAALAAGYRHVDSAQATEWYREDLVGQAIADSGVPRDQLFLTSKLHPKHHGYTTARSQFSESLTALRTTYVDLFLLHYPECFTGLAGCGVGLVMGTWRDSWKALEELYLAGKIRAIGVSNFNLYQVEELWNTAKVKPAVLQVHMDPLSSSAQLRDWCTAHGVQFVAYSSLGTQYNAPTGNPVMSNPTLQDVARRVGRSVPQVALRWALQLGALVIPRSGNVQHIKQNLQVWDFTLTESDMKAIASVEK